MTKYYKCVRKRDMSSAVVSKHIRLNVIYKVGKWVEPSIAKTKLMVFSNKDDAWAFSNYAIDIYECEVKNPTTKKPNTFVDWIYINDEQRFCHYFLDILENKNNKKPYIKDIKTLSQGTVPEGTVFCDAVKLTKRIR